LLSTFACTSNDTAKESATPNKGLTITYLFENGEDTVLLGDTVDFAMFFSNVEFDSLVVFLGRTDSLKLLDTLGTIKVNDKTAFFTFVPNRTGTNKIEGLVKEFKPAADKTIVKSTPFSFRYYCLKSDSIKK
jgi:hypothetical protein